MEDCIVLNFNAKGDIEIKRRGERGDRIRSGEGTIQIRLNKISDPIRWSAPGRFRRDFE